MQTPYYYLVRGELNGSHFEKRFAKRDAAVSFFKELINPKEGTLSLNCKFTAQDDKDKVRRYLADPEIPNNKKKEVTKLVGEFFGIPGAKSEVLVDILSTTHIMDQENKVLKYKIDRPKEFPEIAEMLKD